MGQLLTLVGGQTDIYAPTASSRSKARGKAIETPRKAGNASLEVPALGANGKNGHALEGHNGVKNSRAGRDHELATEGEFKNF